MQPVTATTVSFLAKKERVLLSSSGMFSSATFSVLLSLVDVLASVVSLVLVEKEREAVLLGQYRLLYATKSQSSSWL